jgi:hypothetical protein
MQKVVHYGHVLQTLFLSFFFLDMPLTFDTGEPVGSHPLHRGWVHRCQVSCDIKELVDAFNSEREHYYTREYLIEKIIPRENVVYCWDWNAKSEAA